MKTKVHIKNASRRCPNCAKYDCAIVFGTPVTDEWLAGEETPPRLQYMTALVSCTKCDHVYEARRRLLND